MKIKSEAFPTGMSGWTARITTIHRAAAVLTLQVQQEDVPTAPIL